MVEDASRDGLRYLEVRYCPKLSTRGGLTMEAALERLTEKRGDGATHLPMLEAIERLVGRGVQHDQRGFGLRSQHVFLTGVGGVGFQHNVRTCLTQRFTHAVAGRARAGRRPGPPPGD